jgi:hypothetical protein
MNVHAADEDRAVVDRVGIKNVSVQQEISVCVHSRVKQTHRIQATSRHRVDTNFPAHSFDKADFERQVREHSVSDLDSLIQPS